MMKDGAGPVNKVKLNIIRKYSVIYRLCGLV